ncbi:MurR/RpiR family transcriptional regulator [Marinilactibacillus psychrotolerans]|uniref:MurR/RpiR family transcriptional regulator n=1 Tax=Marinilactibacillus psychrotolerans TaxID=191770 RepID=A0A5R9C7G5_9LACT|nr:MurR/RpiR family transcriptional regulator [Marinilactibacillus psychrotolerans]TLQ09001.1 MurR/RpiR family transcriptional regulator [Marinilactibacillus psychrotolerans]
MNSSYQNIFTRIYSNRSNLTATENEIANYILDNPKETSESTITNLSKKIGVSEASINRFCKKIGFKGFNEFKISVAQDSYYRKMQDKKRAASSIHFSETLSFDYTELINITSENINQELLQNLATEIKQAGNIYIVAFAEAHTVAVHLHYQLLMLSIPSMIITDLSLLKIIAHKCDDNDLFFIITESGNSKELNKLIENAKQNMPKLYVLTSYESSNLTKLATNSIIIPNRLSLNDSSLISSYISYIFVTDLIVGTLIKSDIKFVREKLENEGIITSSDYYPYEY